MAAVSKAEYLKRYLSAPLEEEKKKKRKKKPKFAARHLPKSVIVDDDVGWHEIVPREEDVMAKEQELDAMADEAPVVYDEDGTTMISTEIYKKREEDQRSKWAPIDREDTREVVSSLKHGVNSRSDTSDSSPHKRRQHRSPELSPERNMNRSGKDKRGSKHDVIRTRDTRGLRASKPDNSPPQKRTHESNEMHTRHGRDVKPNKFPPRQQERHDSPDQSHPSRGNRHGSPDQSPRKLNRHGSPNQSPPRRGDRHGSPDKSPPRRGNRHGSPDQSPPRRGNRHGSPYQSPRKLNRHGSPNQSPPRRGDRHGSPDKSPPRRGNRHGSPDQSPPRRGNRHGSPDQSPPRKRNRHDSPDQSPPRRGNRHGSPDQSPPRRGNSHGSSDQSPPRRRNRHDSPDQSPPKRRNRHGSPDQSSARRPARRGNRHDSPDQSALRWKRQDLDLSPARRTLPQCNRTESDSDQSPVPVRRRQDSDSEQSPPRRRPVSPGKASRSGLLSAEDLKRENALKRKQEADMFATMDTNVSGKGSQTVHRDKYGRKRDLEAEKRKKMEEEKKKAKEDEQFKEWGRGVAQTMQSKQKLEEDLHEISKPLARYKDDKDLDSMLRAQDRDDDPMLAYMKKKKATTDKKKGKKAKPVYKGPPPQPNRFGILPGYRWDGVDRSNGFEKKRFAMLANKKATENMAHKWSVEDM